MARVLREKQPSSSVYRLLDCHAAARAIRPVTGPPPPISDMHVQAMVTGDGGPAPRLRPESPARAPASEIQGLLEHYNYLYGTRPEFSFGFQWFSKGRTGGGMKMPPLFGASASRKLMLEAAILLSYARSEGLPLFVIDPDGRFADAVRSYGAQDDCEGTVSTLMKSCCEAATVVETSAILFDRWELFEGILSASSFFENLQIRTRLKVQAASALLVSRLRAIDLELITLHHRESFDVAWRLLADEAFAHAIYAPGGAAAARLRRTIQTIDRDKLWLLWCRLCEPFRRYSQEREELRRPLASQIEDAFGDTPQSVIFDLSERPGRELPWNAEVRNLLVRRLLDGIQRVSGSMSNDGKAPSALVAVQETRG